MALRWTKVFLVPSKKVSGTAQTRPKAAKEVEGGRSVRCGVFCCTEERE